MEKKKKKLVDWCALDSRHIRGSRTVRKTLKSVQLEIVTVARKSYLGVIASVKILYFKKKKKKRSSSRALLSGVGLKTLLFRTHRGPFE